MRPDAALTVRRHCDYLVACGLLLLAVALIFGQTVLYDFVNYDDDVLVYDNPMIARGVTAQGVGWAFTTSVANMWYPLTWISYMLDSQIYGPKPWGFHLTNVLLHAATTVVLFSVLRRMSGNLWASALVALLFAIHPLRVEAVAWVGERKSPLSGLFFVSTIAAYIAYARRPFSLVRYLAVAGLFTLGLLAKPTLVTLPFVLLLLDYWPLGRAARIRDKGLGMRDKRLGTSGARDGLSSLIPHRSSLIPPVRLVVEKIPLLLLSVACCVAAVLSQGANIESLQSVPITARIANSVISYAVYLGQFFWPVGLTVFYPRSESFSTCDVGVAFFVLAAASAAALLLWRKQPAVLVGWLWYLGMLVPMIGLVQIGKHARADRYTYLPQIGLCIAVVWGARWGVQRLFGDGPARRWLCGVGGTLAVIGLMACAWQQTRHWRDSETLWTHALACNSQNPLAHIQLGLVLASGGQADEAIVHYRKALEIKPDSELAHHNLANRLAERGEVDEAIAHYRKALEIKPDFEEAHNNLGNALAGRGEMHEAIAHFRRALEIEPDFAEAHNNLGLALADRGEVDEAIAHFQKAVEIEPDFAEAHMNLANALAGRGKRRKAIEHFQTALRLASARNDGALAAVVRARIKRYESVTPVGNAP